MSVWAVLLCSQRVRARTWMPRSTSSLFRCSTYVTRLEYSPLPLPRREAPRPVRLPLAFLDDEPAAGLGGMGSGGVAGTGDATGGGATAAMRGTGSAKETSLEFHAVRHRAVPQAAVRFFACRACKRLKLG